MKKFQKNKEIIIINSFGTLKIILNMQKVYLLVNQLLKKLKNDSGQNPIDAAKLRCKIYHGPYVYNFEDIYKILEENNISKKKNIQELSKNLMKDLKNQNKKK